MSEIWNFGNFYMVQARKGSELYSCGVARERARAWIKDGPASAPSPTRRLTLMERQPRSILSTESMQSRRRRYCSINIALRNIFTLF
jgi:hypothetical protein